VNLPVSTERRLKAPLPPEVSAQVLALRCRHSLREVAAKTGLPIGTVETICSRSGAFRDNLAHRALFSLPPMQASHRHGAGGSLPAAARGHHGRP